MKKIINFKLAKHTILNYISEYVFIFIYEYILGIL